MSYCTLSELQRYLPRYTIDSTTSPSNTDCQEFIDQVSARIDGALVAEGYSTPIVGAQSLLILKSIALAGSGWYTARIMFPQSSTGLVAELSAEYQSLMAQLISGVLTLPDAAKEITNQVQSGTLILSDTTMNPFVTRGQQF
jgi:hypothetical protein